MEGKTKSPSPQSAVAGVKTKDILDATGITHQILYRYITLGLIEEAETTEAGQRLFAPKTIAAIRLIQRLNQTGYTLRDIKEIFFKEGRLSSAAQRLARRRRRSSKKEGR